MAASIITTLQLTRTIVKEAMKVLSDSREDQQNLMDILGAARFKIIHQGSLYHTVCPRTGCYSRDTFLHMLHCYQLKDTVQKGPEAVPFLVNMARKTHRPKRKKIIPYPEVITRENKKRDWEELVKELQQNLPPPPYHTEPSQPQPQIQQAEQI